MTDAFEPDDEYLYTHVPEEGYQSMHYVEQSGRLNAIRFSCTLMVVCVMCLFVPFVCLAVLCVYSIER